MNCFSKPSPHDEEMERRAAELQEEQARWAAEGGSETHQVDTVPERDADKQHLEHGSSQDNFDADHHIMELEAVLTSMQQELHEKDDQILRLEAILGELEQDLAATDPNTRDEVLTEVRRAASLDRAAALEQQTLLEQRMVELQTICQEKEEHLVQLETALQNSEETLYHQQAEIQTIINGKEQRIAELEQSLTTTREALQAQHPPGSEHSALVEQAMGQLQAAEEQVKKAVDGEARAQHELQEKADHIQQLEAATMNLQQEVVSVAEKERQISELQARLGAAEAEIIELRNRSVAGDVRAEQLQQAVDERDAEIARCQAEMTMTSNRGELVEAETKAILQQALQQAASRKQEMTRLQADLSESDKRVAVATDQVTVLKSSHEASESEVTRLQTLLAEKDHSIAQLREAAASTGMGETEKRALLQQALDAQSKVAQLTKTNEEERTLLSNRLTQQFEAEYAGLRTQLSQVQREANAVVQARDERVEKLEQLVADYEQRLTRRDDAMPTAQRTTLPECDGSTTTHASCDDTQRALSLSQLEAHKGMIQEQLSQAATVATQQQIDQRLLQQQIDERLLQRPLNGSVRTHIKDLPTTLTQANSLGNSTITEQPQQAARQPLSAGSTVSLLRQPNTPPNVQPTAAVTVRRRTVSPPNKRSPMRFSFSAQPATAVNGATKVPSPLYGSLAVPVSGVSGTANAAPAGASPLRGSSPMRSFVAVPPPAVKGALASPMATATASPLRLRSEPSQVPAQAGCSAGVLLGASFKQVQVPVASPVQVASPLASPLRMRPGETVQVVRAASRAASPVTFRVPMMSPNLVSQVAH